MRSIGVALVAALSALALVRWSPDGAAAPGSPHGSAIADMDCSACHTTGGWQLDDAAARGGGFDHAATGFPLLGQHAATACSACHQGNLRPSQSCDRCHRDPHARRLGDSCAECHGPAAWSDTQARARHRRSRMPLTGRHAIIECASCHRRQDARGYAATPVECYACHAAEVRRDIHPDHDGDPAGGVAALPRQCGRCHTTIAWSPAVVVASRIASGLSSAPAQHDARFLLSRGPHRAAACRDCHPSPARPRTFTCAGCHTRARLAPQHRRARLDLSPRACLRCHPGGRAR
ncbi:MAG TPA: cytochrome c3 family protein [Kofleriaceae bacterium]|nr:cytochrome c3 family protein [Kofleriaceae bacterium]